jgi:hypothetical protein
MPLAVIKSVTELASLADVPAAVALCFATGTGPTDSTRE